MKFQNVLAISFVLAISLRASAQTLPFGEVWKQVSESSPMQQAAHLQTESLQESYGRSNRHWLPRIYVDARTFRTNDPAQSFFGFLEQRQVRQTDFDPSELNHPDAATFTRGALGVDLPLYEGGLKMNQVSLYDHALNAQKHESSQIEIEQYAQASLAYASIAILKSQIEKLNTIELEIQKLLKSYQIGQKSNPVGYSGLLGMKSLSNRLSGLLEQYKAQQQAYYKSLAAMGVKTVSWVPDSLNTVKFVDQYLSSQAETSMSHKIKAGQDNAKVSMDMAEMEKARFLPRVGAFAESYTFNGSRDSATGYNAGLYLQWSLYDPSDVGRYKEAKLKAQANEKQVQAMAQQENAELAVAIETDAALRSNLKLLEDSDKLLNEQMQVATTLFRNGSISALQLVEIMNRRTELVMQQNDLELNLIKTAANKITKNNFQIPFQSRNGGYQ